MTTQDSTPVASDKFTLSGQFEGYDSEILGGDSLMESKKKSLLVKDQNLMRKVGQQRFPYALIKS
jgi:hypothetical protein